MADELKLPIDPETGKPMERSKFDKLLNTFIKSRVSTKARDKAVREATKFVITAHKPEYDKKLAELMPK